MKIFVYGTLKRGGALHSVIEDCEFLGEHVTEPKYRLESAGAFPLMASGSYRVKGEIYEVPDELMPILFHIEQAYTFKKLEDDIYFFYYQMPDVVAYPDIYNILTENDTQTWLNKWRPRRK